MRIYNTLSRKKEKFKPIKKNRVGLYTCGPTVYNYAHLGNLRTYLFEDILQRTLEWNGYHVKRVMNITDVGHLTSDADAGEDKIEKEARKEKKSVWGIARFYTKVFFEHLRELRIKKPEIIAPATKFIAEQIAIVRRLQQRGFAYETSKAVYFDVSKFKNYTKLSGQKLLEKIIGARDKVVSDPEKRDPRDFSLWFKIGGRFKNHVMRWGSPWGIGFPGWHLECSAIATKFLGQPFDIHTGGVDHIGTHHPNEIAQSEAAFGKPLAHYFLHGEFLIVRQERMGKSEGNFITLNDLKEKGFDPLSFRYLTLTVHYRRPLNFTWETLTSGEHAYKKLLSKIQLLGLGVSKIGPNPKSAEKINQLIKKFKKRFAEAINDDLNAPRALAALHDFIDEVSAIHTQTPLKNSLRKLVLKEVKIADAVFGLALTQKSRIPSLVRKLVKKRELFRDNKQFTQADRLRKKIGVLGYGVEDTPFGPLILRKSEIRNPKLHAKNKNKNSAARSRS